MQRLLTASSEDGKVIEIKVVESECSEIDAKKINEETLKMVEEFITQIHNPTDGTDGN